MRPITSSVRSRPPLSRTPRFLSVSADPAVDEVAADAHLATLIPAAAATMAAGVEMLGVLTPFLPLPAIPTTLSPVNGWAGRREGWCASSSRAASMTPVASSTVGPLGHEAVEQHPELGAALPAVVDAEHHAHVAAGLLVGEVLPGVQAVQVGTEMGWPGGRFRPGADQVREHAVVAHVPHHSSVIETRYSASSALALRQAGEPAAHSRASAAHSAGGRKNIWQVSW